MTQQQHERTSPRVALGPRVLVVISVLSGAVVWLGLANVLGIDILSQARSLAVLGWVQVSAVLTVAVVYFFLLYGNRFLEIENEALEAEIRADRDQTFRTIDRLEKNLGAAEDARRRESDTRTG